MSTALVALTSVDKRFANGLLALQGTNLEVAPGEFVALLGPSGCGKSTVLRLAAGLDRVTAGRIDAPALRETRAQTAFVFQEPTLMPWANVFDNVWLPLRLAGAGRGAARERIEQALAAVGLGDFAQAFPAELSGGMKMRVSIARALLADPGILILDEATSSLDTESEALIQQGLGELLKGRTTFVIAHRLSTIRRADQILVIEGGLIVERGRHEGLMAAGGRYAEMVTRQAGIGMELFGTKREEGDAGEGANGGEPRRAEPLGPLSMLGPAGR